MDEIGKEDRILDKEHLKCKSANIPIRRIDIMQIKGIKQGLVALSTQNLNRQWEAVYLESAGLH